ncbi:MAG: DNA adenine methylase [Oscillospiraceae bacterium]|nr:DNA adenine methylase [Oscillospiraceae bacterium]
MNSLIKWPGGKSGEIDKIVSHIPEYKRYVEPFFGGGALFFHLKPERALINDISSSLMEYYRLIKAQDKQLQDLLLCYNNSFSNLYSTCSENCSDLLKIYTDLKNGSKDEIDAEQQLRLFIDSISDKINSGFSEKLILDENAFTENLIKMTLDKMKRTVKNEQKAPFSDDDLNRNLLTGFTSGYYIYFRDVFNDIQLKRIKIPSEQYRAANFCFIREYCYGSMFRYNSKGEFNIPYGGMSYNTKNFRTKIDSMFSKDIKDIFSRTDIYCSDFEDFFNNVPLTGDDFIFLDPPYDTDFSDYEGKDFTQNDQERLADALKKTPAQFVLVIKNTDFIRSLYDKDFTILSFDNQYTYNVRSRNERKVEHLIITNI